jgi:hypothetical protein
VCAAFWVIVAVNVLEWELSHMTFLLGLMQLYLKISCFIADPTACCVHSPSRAQLFDTIHQLKLGVKGFCNVTLAFVGNNLSTVSWQRHSTSGPFVYPTSNTGKDYPLANMEAELPNELSLLVRVGLDRDRSVISSCIFLEQAQSGHILNHKEAWPSYACRRDRSRQ